MTAAFNPQRPARGQLAVVTIEVRNDGEGPAEDLILTDEVSHTTELRSASVSRSSRNDGEGPAADLVLTDEVSQTTELRGATSPDGECTVAGRTATCRLGRLDPGDVATVRVRVKVVREPASNSLVQHISLSTGADVDLASRSFSTLVDPGPPRGLALLDIPGPTVTVVALVTFVLAARASPPPISGSR